MGNRIKKLDKYFFDHSGIKSTWRLLLKYQKQQIPYYDSFTKGINIKPKL